MADTPDDRLQCPSCRGMGSHILKETVIGKHGVHEDRLCSFYDCATCGGTGAVTPEQWEAWRDRG